MSKKTDEILTDFTNSLDDINREIPIDKPLYIMLHQFFQDFENSIVLRDYLVAHPEVNIQVIKNTKLVFHDIIMRYIDSLGRIQAEDTVKKLNEIDILHLLDNAANSLVHLALEQEKILKLPTIEQLRGEKLESDKSSNSI